MNPGGQGGSMPEAAACHRQGTLRDVLPAADGLAVAVAAGGVIQVAGAGEEVEVVATVPMWVRLRGSPEAAARALEAGRDPSHSIFIEGQDGPAWWLRHPSNGPAGRTRAGAPTAGTTPGGTSGPGESHPPDQAPAAQAPPLRGQVSRHLRDPLSAARTSTCSWTGGLWSSWDGQRSGWIRIPRAPGKRRDGGWPQPQ